MISITIDFDRVQRGRGFWKFNNSLLKDKEYVLKVHDIFRKVTKQYCTDEDIPEDFWEHASAEELER